MLTTEPCRLLVSLITGNATLKKIGQSRGLVGSGVQKDVEIRISYMYYYC